MRETMIASPSSLGGATFGIFRLEKRSMISATAMMEQASSGQIGQPAACMIESNACLQTGESFPDYGPRIQPARGGKTDR